MPSLNQRARGLSGFNDDGGFGQCRHCRIALGEEMGLAPKVLLGIAHDRHLADDKVLVSDLVLQVPILGRVALSDRRAKYRNRKAAFGHGSCMRHGIDASSES
jgi:hypothetical protein